ncbi:MAG: ribosome silencing factor [Elusimicrobia bacterium]|nr:ribosome silencing factor [Elusimicrobiota bacterium]
MNTDNFLKFAKNEAEKMKAENLLVLDVRAFPTCGEFYLLMTATSPAHINALVKTLTKKIKEVKARKYRIEGLLAKKWVLIDCSDVIIHIFTKEARTFYNIERLWEREKDEEKEE